MARRSTRSSKNSRTLSLDFTNAEERFLPPENRYALEIVGADKDESNSGNDTLKLTFQIIGGKHDGKEFPLWFSLVEQALWKLGGVLRAAGMDIPAEAVELELDDIIGRKLQADITHREYEGRKKAEIEGAEEFEEDEEEEKPKGRRSSKEDEDEKPASRRSRRAAKDEEEEEEKPARSRGRRAAKEEDEEEEEKPSRRSRRGGDDEEEKPKGRSSRRGKKELPKLSGEEVQDMEEDDLEGVIEEYGLDVDLDSFKTLRKKAAAVIDALDTAGHLEEE